MTDANNEIVVKLPEIILGIVRDENGVPTHLAKQETTFYDFEAALRLAHGLEDIAEAMLQERRDRQKFPAKYEGGPVAASD